MRSSAPRARWLRRLVVASGIVVPIACALPLEELAPFPCAEDGTCPAGYLCDRKGDCITTPQCSGGKLCIDTCRDIDFDEENCGDCGITCSGATECCQRACVDTTTDPLHCGSCGVACGALATCTASACACVPGAKDCGAGCVDPSTDPLNCGDCGIVCSAIQICSAGDCVCNPANLCNGICSDLLTDPLNCGSCEHSCQGTACSGGMCAPVVLASGQARPSTVVVDNGLVYWTNRGTEAADYLDGSIMVVPADGSAAAIALASALPRPVGIAVDGGYLYWVNRGTSVAQYQDSAIWRMPLPAGPPEQLAGGLPDAGNMTISTGYLFGQTTGTPGNAGMDGAIYRIPLGGGAVQFLANGQRAPVDVAADGSYVFWVNAGTFVDMTFNDDASASRANHDGGNLLTMAVQPGAAFGAGIAVSGSTMVFSVAGTPASSYADGHVVSQSIFGGDTPVDVAASQVGPRRLASDGSDVFWIAGSGTRGIASLRKATIRGGGPVTTLLEDRELVDVAIDAASVYATASGTQAAGFADGAIVRVPK
jgi:stigma-specific protein Stig1